MNKPKISKILIANRGEIACRIIRTAKKMGIESVAIYSDADQNAQHVQLADEAWYVGPSPAKQSYLQAETILSIAKNSNADAVHPGYGFLSENHVFADTCKKNNIIFIGPPSHSIFAMGSKSEAKNIMSAAQVPLVTGYHGEDQDESLLHKEARKIGYPLLIKATAGGGGKGMRVVNSDSEFIEALHSCKREALSSFGDQKVLIEKYLTKPRHIEIQVFADSLGNAVHLFERDCSVQRRHQKVIEEAPAPNFSKETRSKMGEVAITAAKAIGYQGAGTVEFLYDEDGSFYFMEMNTRLQVEHPVTEKITGLDLVEWQILVANGEPLPRQQHELNINGHAFEARIYAEEPNNDFLPATGKITHLELPNLSKNVRVDSGIVSGDSVSIYYDPMIAKLIVWDENRSAALARLRGALADFQVAGVETNIEFLHQLAANDSFKEADLDTHFLDKHGDELLHLENSPTATILAAAILKVMLEKTELESMDSNSRSQEDPYSPWKDKMGWRLNQDNHHIIEFEHKSSSASTNHLKVIVHFREFSNTQANQNRQAFLFEFEGKEYQANGYIKNEKVYLNLDGHQTSINCIKKENQIILFKDASNWIFNLVDQSNANIEINNNSNLTAPMPGTIIEVLVQSGDQVEEGQALVVMEAMKMEHTITAHKSLVVDEVIYRVGDLVEDGAELIVFVES